MQFCPNPNFENEKTPEILNNFRGLVVLYNGGEIGI